MYLPRQFREDRTDVLHGAIRDYPMAQLVTFGAEGLEAVRGALDLYDVDELGLDRLDRAVVLGMLERFDGGPVGLNTLAVSVGEESETIESVVEPFLVRVGLVTRTPRGRIATPLAWRHFGLTPGQGAAGLQPGLFDSE